MHQSAHRVGHSKTVLWVTVLRILMRTSLIHPGDIILLLKLVAEKFCPFEFVFLFVRRRGLSLPCLGLGRRWHRHRETEKHHDDEYRQYEVQQRPLPGQFSFQHCLQVRSCKRYSMRAQRSLGLNRVIAPSSPRRFVGWATCCPRVMVTPELHRVTHLRRLAVRQSTALRLQSPIRVRRSL